MAYYRPRWTFDEAARRRRQLAMQQERRQAALLGGAGTQRQETATPQQGGYNLSDFIRYASLRRQFQPVARPRWGQQVGYGQGYIPPRRQVGGQHLAVPERMRQGYGYAPRTAAMLYGGRPMGGYYQPPQMNQMMAMTRYQWSPNAYLGRPWGGAYAVRRWY